MGGAGKCGLWADPDAVSPFEAAAGGLAPSLRLFVLEAHREPPVPPWLDRAGVRAAALARRWLSRPVHRLRRRARAVLEAATPLHDLDDDALRLHIKTLAETARVAFPAGGGAAADAALEASLSGVVAAVLRVTGLMPHVEQVMGTLALLDAAIVEMATGEGKTLTATMAAVAAAWRGRPCHVVTANDYLARRDAELFTRLYAFCGLSVTHIDGETAHAGRAAAHSHDVVYTTAKELLGDYLRDRLAMGKTPTRVGMALDRLAGRAGEGARRGASGGAVVMRGVHQVIVDEADSVLIDEAVTPLIISTPRPDEAVEQAARDAVALASALEPDRHFQINHTLRHVDLTPEGQEHLAGMTGAFSAFWQNPDRAREVVEQALYAQHMLVRDQHYVVRDDKIVLVDELTGRLAEQRTLSVGMQQVLEASQALPVTPPTEISARLSFQRFFRCFPRVGGMTGTAQEAQAELMGVYRLPTLSIPPHRPVRRRFLPWQFCGGEAEKFAAIARSALAMAESGRAVLVGMRSVRSSVALHRAFTALDPVRAEGIRLLHAVNHRLESAIVARAGDEGAITVATNMAGRGTDIALAACVRERGGLHVIIGEPNDYGRIDRQLVGRCARQGDPGSVQIFVCLEDELIRRYLPGLLTAVWRRVSVILPVLALVLAPTMVGIAQHRAQRLSFRQRQTILEQDIHLDKAAF